MATVTTSGSEIGVPPQHASLFFTLPAELRNCIYHLAVKRSDRIQVRGKIEVASVQPALSRTCKAIRSEVLPIYYSNDFIIGICMPFQEHRSFNYLKAIGSRNRALLEHVYVLAFELEKRAVNRGSSDFFRWLKKTASPREDKLDQWSYCQVDLVSWPFGE